MCPSPPVLVRMSPYLHVAGAPANRGTGRRQGHFDLTVGTVRDFIFSVVFV